MNEFNKQNLTEVRNAINSALAELGKKMGIAFSIGQITFTPGDFRTKLTAVAAGAKGGGTLQLEDKIAMDFKKKAFLVELKAQDLGREFVLRGTTYAIAGLKPQARKTPIIGRNVKTGKLYRFATEDVLCALDPKRERQDGFNINW